ncbi:hypothetical protein Tco_0322222 [Tanacetum coccineum]
MWCCYDDDDDELMMMMVMTAETAGGGGGKMARGGEWGSGLGRSEEEEHIWTVKLRNDILMFQQHHGESLFEAWTRFKDLQQKVSHHGIDQWLQIHIFYDHVDYTTQIGIDYVAGRRLRKLRPDEAWATIEELAQYEDEGWNDTFIPGKKSLNYKNPNIKQLLGITERKVDTLVKNAISLMGRSKGVFRMTINEMYQLPPEPSRQEEFEHIVMNFILDQEERVGQLKEYMKEIIGDFIQLFLEVTWRLKDKLREEGGRLRKIKKITKYPDKEVPKPLAGQKFPKTPAKKNVP